MSTEAKETLVRAADFCSKRLRQGASGTFNRKPATRPGHLTRRDLACGNELKNSLANAQPAFTNSTSLRFVEQPTLQTVRGSSQLPSGPGRPRKYSERLERVQILVTKDIREAAEREALRQCVSISEIYREWIEKGASANEAVLVYEFCRSSLPARIDVIRFGNRAVGSLIERKRSPPDVFALR